MSIRKQFMLSHAAMIMTPIVIIILIMLLLKVVLVGNTELNFGQQGYDQQDESVEIFQRLIKTASLNQEKLMDTEYLNALLNHSDDNLIVRKSNELLYTSKEMDKNKLPAFGSVSNKFNPKGIWINEEHYSVMQYDFYFKDGTEGSIFLLNQASSFAKNARVFFPVLFLTLIFTLILTNLLLSYFMSRNILRPIKKLSAAAENIRNENFDFEMEPNGKNELNKLIQTFDTMRAQLKETFELREKYETNRKELIANISHDLKTPITSILGYVEGLEKGIAKTPEKEKQYLETIHSKASYMNQLIEELALFSKLDVNREPFHFESVNIHKFVSDYLEEMEDDLHDKHIQWTLNDENMNVYVLIDRNKLIRVLENIIYNSVKYMNNVAGQINISLTNQEKNVLITISDNGLGVPEEELSAIFSRFYRVDSSRSQGGSGLGLAIAKQIIEAHGGTIWAENNSTGGLIVHFTLKKSEDDRNE
ncbi:HAMP domain-containing sensor histidine kinase [Fredinandcohnia sp. FSL W7-1320]|uniref:sensor histidine kinase n=2 Tax=Fredinandcohnia sp. FSL W7-1320 TaxID=2954540 RepID=UPI0030FD4F3C